MHVRSRLKIVFGILQVPAQSQSPLRTFVSFVSFVSCPGATAVKVRALKFCQILPQYITVLKGLEMEKSICNMLEYLFSGLSDGYNGLHIAETYPNHLQASIRNENEVKTSRAHQRTPNHQALGPSCGCQNTWNILKYLEIGWYFSGWPSQIMFTCYQAGVVAAMRGGIVLIYIYIILHYYLLLPGHEGFLNRHLTPVTPVTPATPVTPRPSDSHSWHLTFLFRVWSTHGLGPGTWVNAPMWCCGFNVPLWKCVIPMRINYERA